MKNVTLKDVNVKNVNLKSVKLFFVGIVAIMAGFIILMSIPETSKKADYYMNRARQEAQVQMESGKSFDECASASKKTAKRLYRTVKSDRIMGILFIGAGSAIVLVEKKKIKESLVA